MSMSWIDAWSFAKDAVFPLIGILWAFFKQKIDKLQEDIEDNEDKCKDLEKKLVIMESTYATKAEVTALLQSIQQTLINNGSTLEARIEKIMDLKNEPLKVMLEEVYRKMEK